MGKTVKMLEYVALEVWVVYPSGSAFEKVAYFAPPFDVFRNDDAGMVTIYSRSPTNQEDELSTIFNLRHYRAFRTVKVTKEVT